MSLEICICNSVRTLFRVKRVSAECCTFKAVLQTVFHDHEELLQRGIIGVQRPTEAQSRLDQPFNAELGHVQQVGPLHRHRIPEG